MDATTAVIIGAAIGAGVSGLFALISIHLQRRAEERRQIRELAVQVALENWKIYKAVADNQGGLVPPIDTFLIHAVHLISALDGRLKTHEQIREHLRAGFAASAAATAEIDEHNKEIQKERRKGVV